MNKVIGVILIAVGIILMVWWGFTYSQKDKAAKTLQVVDDSGKSNNWLPYTGAFFLAGGLTIMVMSKKDDKIW